MKRLMILILILGCGKADQVKKELEKEKPSPTPIEEIDEGNDEGARLIESGPSISPTPIARPDSSASPVASATPEPSPTPTATPEPSPSPSPSPTPHPIIGVWKQVDDPDRIFVFADTEGSCAPCSWTFDWEQYSMNLAGTGGDIKLTGLSGVMPLPFNYCKPNAGNVWGGTKYCSWLMIDANTLQLGCQYDGGHIYERQ